MRWLVGATRTLRQASAFHARFAVRSFAEEAESAAITQHKAGEWPEEFDALSKELATDEAKRELQGFKSAYFDWKRKTEEWSKEPEPIDWEYYKKEVDPELVGMFEEAFKNMPIPKYPYDEVAQAKEAMKEVTKEYEEMVAHSKKRIAELEKEIEANQRQMDRIATMTVDEVLAENPEIAKEIDDEISNRNFG